MDVFALTIKLLLSAILGGVIGLEREVNEKKYVSHKEVSALVGLRSFALVCILGTLAGLLYAKFLIFSVCISIVFFLMLLIVYVMDSLQTKDPGITSELALLYSYVIGFLIAVEILPMQLVIAVTVLLLLLLSRKRWIKHIVTGIKNHELNAFITYLIIAFVILPFIPNQSYSLQDSPQIVAFLKNINFYNEQISGIEILNPFRLWFIVALVTGVDFAGYVLESVFGKKRGWLMASAIGGFISSTATTQSLAKESKTNKNIQHLVGAAMLANVVSFVQVIILIAPVNGDYLARLLPTILLMIITGLLITLFLLRKKENGIDDKVLEVKESKIIDLGFALKFAILYIAIGIFAKISLVFFGNNGLFIVTALGAFVGLDAVIINIAQLAGKQISFQTAAYAFILANAVNLLAKCLYSYLLGAKEFTKLLLIGMILIIGLSLISLLLFGSLIF